MRSLEQANNTGKTYALVEEMLKPGNEDMIYVAPTMTQARQIGLRTALALGAGDTKELRERFLPVSSLPGALRGRKVRVIIDEADGVLQQLLGAPVALMAYTPDHLKYRSPFDD